MSKQRNYFMSSEDQAAFFDFIRQIFPDACAFARLPRQSKLCAIDWECVRSANDWSFDIFLAHSIADVTNNFLIGGVSADVIQKLELVEFTPSITKPTEMEVLSGRLFCNMGWLDERGNRKLKSEQFGSFVKSAFDAVAKVCPLKHSSYYVGNGAEELRTRGYEFV